MASMKKKATSNMYPQFPRLKDFFTEFISFFTGVNPTDRMIYGLKRDNIANNEPKEIDVTGNCLLETLFYVTEPTRCDGLLEDVCQIDKKTFSKNTRLELVDKFKEVHKVKNAEVGAQLLDSEPLTEIVKKSTYLGPESLKLFALIFNCSFIVFVILPDDIAVNYYCNTNPSRKHTYVLILKGATGQHFIPLVRKMDPKSFVLKALTRVEFRLFEEDKKEDQITENYRLKKNMDVFKRKQKEHLSRILDLTCNLDELTSKLTKYIPKTEVKPRIGIGIGSDPDNDSDNEPKGKPRPRIGLGLGLRSEPNSDNESKSKGKPTRPPLPPRPLSQKPSLNLSLPLPEPLPEPSGKKNPPKLPPRPSKSNKQSTSTIPVSAIPALPSPKSKSKSRQNNTTHKNLNQNRVGVYLPKSDSNTNNNTNEQRWRLLGKGQTRKEFKNKRNKSQHNK